MYSHCIDHISALYGRHFGDLHAFIRDDSSDYTSQVSLISCLVPRRCGCYLAQGGRAELIADNINVPIDLDDCFNENRE